MNSKAVNIHIVIAKPMLGFCAMGMGCGYLTRSGKEIAIPIVIGTG